MGQNRAFKAKEVLIDRNTEKMPNYNIFMNHCEYILIWKRGTFKVISTQTFKFKILKGHSKKVNGNYQK